MARHGRGGGQPQQPKRTLRSGNTPVAEKYGKQVRFTWKVFCEEGQNVCGNVPVQFYVNDTLEQGPPVQTRTQDGMASHLFILDPNRGNVNLRAQIVGRAISCSAFVSLEEFKESAKTRTASMDVDPAGRVQFDSRGYAFLIWTPRVFDEDGKAIDARLHVVGSRPFYLHHLGENEQGPFPDVTIPLNKDRAISFKLVVPTPERCEFDVYDHARNLHVQFMIDGAQLRPKRPRKQPNIVEWFNFYRQGGLP